MQQFTQARHKEDRLALSTQIDRNKLDLFSKDLSDDFHEMQNRTAKMVKSVDQTSFVVQQTSSLKNL